MKTLPDGMADILASGTTTLCWCWRLTRQDSHVLGFTDHDYELTLDGTTFEATAGFTASELRDTIGLSVDNLDVEGALTSDRLNEADLLAGLFDDAQVEIFRVNWQDTTQRILMRTGSLGEVRRQDAAFVAEIRGLAHYLQQPKGRLYQYTCDADLGDQRCSINLSDPVFRGSGSVDSAVDTHRFNLTGFAAYDSEWFTRGILTFDNGANAGGRYEVRSHTLNGGTTTIELWRQPPHDVAAGDAVSLVAGCDKVFTTCRDKFANLDNFRGFPHMPGMDFVTSYV